jgi:hypothetical protein
VASINFGTPFDLVTRTLTLRSADRPPPALGPPVSVASVHLKPETDESGLSAIVSGRGLRARNQLGLMAHDTIQSNMWLGSWTKDLTLEFELAEAVPLGAIQIWNYNAPWQTAKGIAKADIAVSTDGITWTTVWRGAAFTEADGTENYDEPTTLKLDGVTTRKVRFENLVGFGAGDKVGLSKVVFHGTASSAAPPQPPGTK